MARRSLKSSSIGVQAIKNALKRSRWSQTYLAGVVGCSRQTIWNLLQGNPIDCDYFMEICSQLSLNWQEIAQIDLQEQKDTNLIVESIRERIKPIIQHRCGTMRVLDMTQPVGLNDIYTDVNVLETITGRRRKGISELLEECNPEKFERFGLGNIKERRVPGLKVVEQRNKLLILGKPGAGKTTFLKYLALQCNAGNFKSSHVPIFVVLKDFAEASQKPNLFDYLIQELSTLGIDKSDASALLIQGKALILLDGLDEVREEENSRVLSEICKLSNRFYENHFVMTCRIAAREYTFDQFSEVEVADFDDKQIEAFANNWFKLKDPVKAEKFVRKLRANAPIKELATNPLLLTLLCLVFETTADFPSNRSELYEEGLDILLKKWDAERNIERDQLYKNLSLKRKEDLLGRIALETFERSEYFFKQKTVEKYITDYISNLPDINTDPQALHLDSIAILRSIEAQHGLLIERAKGIYSFSHLTFHEYFTARDIVLGSQAKQGSLENLVRHITEKRWREVFLLTVGMFPNADHFLRLIKHEIELTIADKNLQKLMLFINKKAKLLGNKQKKYKYLFECNEPTLLKLFACLFIGEFNYSGGTIAYKKIAFLKVVRTIAGLGLKEAKDFVEEIDGNLGKLLSECAQIEYYSNLNDQKRNLIKQYYDASLLLLEFLNSDCYVSKEVRQSLLTENV